MTRLLLVGKGRAGTSLEHALTLAGAAPDLWWSRRDGGDIAELPAADVVVLAVADDAIAAVAGGLALRPSASEEVWLHLSGALPADILRVAEGTPRAVGGLHVLQALDGSPIGLDHLTGVTAGLDGDEEAMAVAESLAQRLTMVPRRLVPGTKALYHAAAVSVAGHATALFAQAQAMLAACGLDEAAAREMLRPLIAGAVRNLVEGAPAEVVTGPIARGDAGIVERHLDALTALESSELKATYRLLAATALELSAPGLASDRVDAIRRLLASEE